jgi:hypothetical protein
MAESEHEALQAIERGFAAVLPNQAVELLLADNSHAHLSRQAAWAPGGVPAGGQVASPQECPAARRSRVHEFPDSDAVNACPKLLDREQGRCSALCIPVSVMGRTVGVIHTVGEFGVPVDSASVQDLQSIGNQAGARLGMLRIRAPVCHPLQPVSALSQHHSSTTSTPAWRALIRPCPRPSALDGTGWSSTTTTARHQDQRQAT